MEQDILDYIANYQANQANINALNQAALAAAQGTGASNIDYYVNPIGAGEIIPGTNAGILANLGMYNPEYQAVMQTYGSRNDRSNVNDVTERSTFAVDPNADYRLLDASGKVIGTASTPSEVRNLVDTANSISAEQGKKAEWSLQTTGQTGDWSTVAKDDPNKFGPVGIITDFALPLLASAAIPGAGLLGTILPAAAGSAASSVLQGRGLEDTLLRAGLAGAGAGIGEAIFTPAKAAADAATQVATTTAGNVATQTAAQKLAEEAAKAAAGEIIVTGTRSFIPSLLSSAAGSLASSIVPSFFDSAQLDTIQQPGGQTDTQAPSDGGEIFVDAIKNPPVNIDPGSLIGSTISSVVPPTNTPPVDAGELIVTAPPGTQVITPPVIPPVFLPPGTTTPPSTKTTTDTTKAEDNKGVLGTGLTTTQALAITGLLGSLIGGGGGSVTTSGPYVSPFGGTGVLGGMAGGVDYRVNPNIIDYERYGFGPEATFFRPEYGTVVANNTPATTTPSYTATPMYTPLV
jgi:hypothetical protein